MRQEFWDWLKAIAIAAVITIHTSNVNLVPAGSKQAFFIVGLRQVVSFAVPLFFGLSGLMAGYSSKSKDINYISDRIKRLIWPYLIWTLIYIVLFHRQHLISPLDIALDVFAGIGIGIGYFIVVLIQMILLTPFIDRIRSNLLHATVMIMGFLVGIVFTYARLPGWSNFPYSSLPFVVWYPFYHLGYVIAKQVDLNVRRPGLILIFSASYLFFLFVSFLEGFELLPSDQNLAISQVKLSSKLMSLSLFALAMLIFPWCKSKSLSWLAWIGQNSFFIYLVHIAVLKGVNRVINNFASAGSPSYIAISVLSTLIVCCVFSLIMRRVLPEKLKAIIIG